jgi:hypothetical protein
MPAKAGIQFFGLFLLVFPGPRIESGVTLTSGRDFDESLS